MRTESVFQPLVLAGLLAAGFVVVWWIAAEWFVAVAEHVLGGEGWPHEQLVFLADGTPRVARSVGPRGDRVYRDLEGNLAPAPDGEREKLLTSRLAAAPVRAANMDWEQRVRSFADGRSPVVYWYFVSDGRPDGTAYFVGYDSKSNARVGYVGTAGFRAELPPDAERFPYGGPVTDAARVVNTQPLYNNVHPSDAAGGRAPRGSLSTWDVYVLGRDGKVYHADLQARTSEVVLDVPGVRSLTTVAGTHDPVRGTPHYLAARTGEAVLVLDEHGGPRKRYPIPEALRGEEFSFGETAAGEAVVWWHSPMDAMATVTDYRIFRVSAEGRCHESEVTLAARGPSILHKYGGVILPCPLALAAVVALGRAGELLDNRLVQTYPEALARAFADYRSALLVAQFVAAGLAVLCYRRQVRYGVGRAERVIWPLFVLALGLPGWVGYRFGRGWPVLESCPACGAAAPRDRGECARCAAEFSRPRLKGTEVFA